MSGTWTLRGKTVAFTQLANTFVSDARFTAERDRLRADTTFSGGTRVQVVLAK